MLSCSCGDYNHEWYYYSPDDFIQLKTSKRKRCYSCGELINIGSDCVEFERFREPYGWVEEKIYGDEVPLAPKYMCFECGSIFLNLNDLGYCITIGGHMKEELYEYWDITGFKPLK
jgi:hypothetical protein